MIFQHTSTAPDVLNRVIEKLNTLQEHSDGLIGHSTGFTELDNKTLGLQDGQLTIIGARPSMGNVTLAFNMAEAVLYRDIPVLAFSMDMPAESVMFRMISSFSAINQTNLITGCMSTEEWGRFTSGVAYLNEKPLYIHDNTNLSVDEMQCIANQLQENEQRKLGLIVIDYLQLVKTNPLVPLEDEMQRIGKELKALAVKLNCHVVVTSFLHRDLESRLDKRPMLYDFAQAEPVAQHADTVLFIYREEVYREDSNLKGVAEISIAKQRQGLLGKVPLLFEPQFSRFRDLTPEYYQGLEDSTPI